MMPIHVTDSNFDEIVNGAIDKFKDAGGNP